MTKSLAQLPVQLAPNAPQEEGVERVETGGRLPSNEPKLEPKGYGKKKNRAIIQAKNKFKQISGSNNFLIAGDGKMKRMREP